MKQTIDYFLDHIKYIFPPLTPLTPSPSQPRRIRVFQDKFNVGGDCRHSHMQGSAYLCVETSRLIDLTPAGFNLCPLPRWAGHCVHSRSAYGLGGTH